MKIEIIEVNGFMSAIKAMRMPYESGIKSDSKATVCGNCHQTIDFVIGPDDLVLMGKLIKGGAEHRSFLRFIQCYAEITAPRFWWQECDRYRIGKEQISSSTMHLLTKRDLTQDDFEYPVHERILGFLNFVRNNNDYSEKDKKIIMKTNLPESFLQKRVVMFSYETLLTIYRQRKDHELLEWFRFCSFVRDLPYMRDFIGALK